MINIAIFFTVLILHILLGALAVKAATNRCYFSIVISPFIAVFSTVGTLYCIKLHSENVHGAFWDKVLLYIERGFMYVATVSGVCILLITILLAMTTIIIDIIREIQERKEHCMKYYIADLHFYHFNMLNRMDKRGFDSLEDMHIHMIRQWNSKVGKNDEVIILGDLSMGNGQQTNEILRRLNGKKVLIVGNHDHKFLRDENFNRSLLTLVKEYGEINDGGRKVILSHYPMLFYNGQYRLHSDGRPKTYMLHGHIHDTQDTQLLSVFESMFSEFTYTNERTGQPDKIPCNLINCFCMFSDYIPLTLNEWLENEKAKTIKPTPKTN